MLIKSVGQLQHRFVLSHMYSSRQMFTMQMLIHGENGSENTDCLLHCTVDSITGNHNIFVLYRLAKFRQPNQQILL